jgi:glycosyltransferase involved in cell wall biosynthesis
MASEKPTILAIDGVIRQVVEAAAGGVYVSPGDDEALAAAVLKLAMAPENAREMGKAARAYVIRHFNRAEQAQAFVSLVSSMGKT